MGIEHPVGIKDATKPAFDFLVIGCGPGGTPAAMALAQAGRRVMLVEGGEGLGGTCLFEGCIPSKIFRETAARLGAIQAAATFGIDLAEDKPAVVWSRVLERKRQILTGRSQAALANAGRLPNLHLVHGHARLLGPRTAEIKTSDGAVSTVAFRQAILATGSEPMRPPFPGNDLPGVWVSDQLLSLDHVPRSLILLGGGPIGVEMAQIYAQLGSRVVVLEARAGLLEGMEADLAQRLQDMLQASGIDVRCGVRVQDITRNAAGLAVRLGTGQDQSETLTAVSVGLAVGRRPRVQGLGLEQTRVQLLPQGMKVDAQLQTDEPGIYALGDLLGQPMFAHWATAQAMALVQHLLDRPATFPQVAHNTAVIFSHPEFAIAGLTAEQARAAGLDVDIATYDYAIDARAQIAAQTGLLRLVFERANHRLVGMHALVEGAADLIGEGALAVRLGATLEQLAQTIHPHPTLTEAIGLLARQTLMRLQAAEQQAPPPPTPGQSPGATHE